MNTRDNQARIGGELRSGSEIRALQPNEAATDCYITRGFWHVPP